MQGDSQRKWNTVVDAKPETRTETGEGTEAEIEAATEEAAAVEGAAAAWVHFLHYSKATGARS